MRPVILALLIILPALAQDIKIPPEVERLGTKAKETVDITLDGSLLQFAARFLSSEKPDEARAKKLIGGIRGIYVRSFHFDREGQFTESHVESIRGQMRGPGWSRLMSFTHVGGHIAEVYTRSQAGVVAGVVIFATEPRELTVVNLVGTIDLDQLADLGGHFGIPRFRFERSKEPKR